MERAGSKKIIKCLGSWVFLGILLWLCVCLTFLYTESVKRKQLFHMLTEHPELEGELIETFQKGAEDSGSAEQMEELIKGKYGYSVWRSAITENGIRLWGVLFAGVSLIVLPMMFFQARKEWGDRRELDNRFLWLENALEQLKEGNFEIPLYKGEMAEDADWNRVCSRITDLSEYLEDLMQRIKKEENNTKSLVTDLSHQLKTPLSSLKISHELASSEQLTESERREFFEQEAYEIEKFGILLEELVKLSRLESHMIQIHTEITGIKGTITQAVNQVYQKAYQKHIEIQVEMDQDHVLSHDPKWTVEALVNVLDNAIKYSGKDMQIRLRVSELPMNLLIEIEDEGIGIPKEELHKIFQRFYRGREAAEFAKEGAGVGLALARSILGQQGGTISAKRKKENGTVFRITLPR